MNSSNMRWRSAELLMSARCQDANRPKFAMPAIVLSASASRSMSLIPTSAPCSANALAMPAPIPRRDPVINAFFSFKKSQFVSPVVLFVALV